MGHSVRSSVDGNQGLAVKPKVEVKAPVVLTGDELVDAVAKALAAVDEARQKTLALQAEQHSLTERIRQVESKVASSTDASVIPKMLGQLGEMKQRLAELAPMLVASEKFESARRAEWDRVRNQLAGRELQERNKVTLETYRAALAVRERALADLEKSLVQIAELHARLLSDAKTAAGMHERGADCRVSGPSLPIEDMIPPRVDDRSKWQPPWHLRVTLAKILGVGVGDPFWV